MKKISSSFPLAKDEDTNRAAQNSTDKNDRMRTILSNPLLK